MVLAILPPSKFSSSRFGGEVGMVQNYYSGKNEIKPEVVRNASAMRRFLEKERQSCVVQVPKSNFLIKRFEKAIKTRAVSNHLNNHKNKIENLHII